MSNTPHMGNAKQKIMENMVKEFGADMPVEYRLSAWLQVKTDWDEDAKRPVRMTPEQEAQVAEVFALIQRYNIQLNLQVQQRTAGEAKDWPTVARWKVFHNKPKQQQDNPMASAQSYAQASGGSGMPDWNNL